MTRSVRHEGERGHDKHAGAADRAGRVRSLRDPTGTVPALPEGGSYPTRDGESEATCRGYERQSFAAPIRLRTAALAAACARRSDEDGERSRRESRASADESVDGGSRSRRTGVPGAERVLAGAAACSPPSYDCSDEQDVTDDDARCLAHGLDECGAGECAAVLPPGASLLGLVLALGPVWIESAAADGRHWTKAAGPRVSRSGNGATDIWSSTPRIQHRRTVLRLRPNVDRAGIRIQRGRARAHRAWPGRCRRERRRS